MIICLSPGICIKLIGSLNCGHSLCRLLMVFHVDHIVFRERWFWFFPNLQAFLVMLAQCPLFGEYEPFYDGPSVHLTQLRLGPPIPCGTNLFQPHFIHSLPKLHTSTFLQKLLILCGGGELRKPQSENEEQGLTFLLWFPTGQWRLLSPMILSYVSIYSQ